MNSSTGDPLTPSPTLQAENLTQKAVAGAGWSSLATAGRQLLSFASVALLARLLGPGAYGLIGMAALVTGFLVNFRDLGTAAAVVQSKKTSHELLSSLFWINLVTGAFFTLLVVAAALPTARFFHEPRLTAVLLALAPSFLLYSAGAVHMALLTREMAFRKVAAIDLGAAAAGYLVSIPTALLGWGVWSLVWANIANAFGATLLAWVLCKWRPSKIFHWSEIASISKFSRNLSGFALVNYFNRNADNLVVGHFLGGASLGFYQMAYNLMLFPVQNISSVLSQVLFPGFSRIQDDHARFRSAYLRSCMLIGLITFPTMAGLGVVAKPFVNALLGANWIPVIPVFQILAPVGLLQSVQSSVGQIYTAQGRTDWMFRWGAAAAVIYVIAFLVGVQYGIFGVAGAYAVTSLFVLSYPSFSVPFRLIGLPVRTFVLAMLPQLGITAVMTAVCWAVLLLIGTWNPWLQLACVVPLGALLYIALLVLVRPPVIGHLEEVLGSSTNNRVRRLLNLLRRVPRR